MLDCALWGIVAAATACGDDPGRRGDFDQGSFGETGPQVTAGDASSDTEGDTEAASTGEDTGVPDPATSGDDSATAGDQESFPQIATVARPAGIVEDADGNWTYEDNTVFYEIGKSFYAEHPDEYDFLAVYTEGEFSDYWAQALTVRLDLGGIGYDGIPAWVEPSDVGSDGALQQINVMNIPDLYDFDPTDIDVLVHETAHRWAAFVELSGTPEAGYLLGPNGGHWNIHVDTGGPSATGYGALTDLGGGRFEFASVYPLRLSALELYFAGLIPASEVPTMFYVQSTSDYDPPTSYDGAWQHTAYGEDATFSGTRVDFTIDDIIATNGPRTPAAEVAQTHFRFAFVMVCNDPAACDPAQLAIVEAQRTAFVEGFALATGDRATVSTDL